MVGFSFCAITAPFLPPCIRACPLNRPCPCDIDIRVLFREDSLMTPSMIIIGSC